MLEPSVVFDPFDTVPLTAFTTELQFEFPDLVSEAMPHYIMKTIRRFAKITNALRRRIRIQAIHCVDRYLLEPPDCVDILAIMDMMTEADCSCNGRVRIHRFMQDPLNKNCCGMTSWWDQDGIIFLKGVGNSRLTAIVSVAPRLDACEVDRIILDKYFDVIMAGVKSQIMGMPQKPWSSVERSRLYKQDFEAEMRAITVDTLMNGQRGVFKRTLPRIL